MIFLALFKVSCPCFYVSHWWAGGLYSHDLNREASLFIAIICPVWNLLPNLNLRLLPFSMCVPSRLSSLERLEIPESIRENAMWLIRVSRVGRLGAVSTFVILSKLSVRVGCPWSVRRKSQLWMLTYCRALNIYCNCFWRCLGVWHWGPKWPCAAVFSCWVWCSRRVLMSLPCFAHCSG